MAAPDWTRIVYEKHIKALKLELKTTKEKFERHRDTYIHLNGDDGSEYLLHQQFMSSCHAYAIKAIEDLEARVGTKKDIIDQT